MHTQREKFELLQPPMDARGLVLFENFRPFLFKGNARLSSDASALGLFRPDEIGSLTLKNCDTLKCAELARISKLPLLEYLDLNNITDLDDSIIPTINELNHLKELMLADTQVTTEGLLKLKRLNDFEYFEIRGLKNVNRLLTVLSDSKSLIQLRLPHCDLDGESIHLISKIKQLEMLQLSQCPQINDDLMQPLSQLKRLRYLNVGACSVSAAPFANLDFKALTELDVAGNHWSEADIQRIRMKFPHLQLVTARKDRFRDENMKDVTKKLMEM